MSQISGETSTTQHNLICVRETFIYEASSGDDSISEKRSKEILREENVRIVLYKDQTIDI